MSATRKNNYMTVPTPGDGQSNCFYNAVMLAIIHDILADRLDEESETALVIQHYVLPEIGKKLKTFTGFTFHFEEQPLKKSILQLLHAVSLKTPLSDAGEEITAIRKSHLHILLKEVCAPVLRHITYEGLDYRNARGALRCVMETSFHAYLKSSKPFELCMDDDEHTAALKQKDDEFYGLPNDFQTSIQKSWDEKYAEKQAHMPAAPVNLTEAFNEWWSDNQNTVCAEYFTIKAENNTPAGLPEQAALEDQLHCRIGIFNQSSQRIDPLYHGAAQNDSQHVFVLDASQAFHFNAVVENTEIGSALAKHMQDLSQDAGLVEAVFNNHEADFIVPALAAKTEECIDQTKTLIAQIETYSDWKNNLSQAETDIIQAAKEGYKQARFFSTPAEAGDLEYAIQLQNEELASFFNKRFSR